MHRRLLVTAALVLGLSSAAARAEDPSAPTALPAGNLYFGVSGEAVQPFGLSLIDRQRLTTGGAFGLSLLYEGERFLIGAELTGGHFGHDDTYSNPFQLALRAGPILGSGPVAPYVALGVSAMAFGSVVDDAAGARGLSGEVGVLAFRNQRWFRATAFIQYNLPLSSSGGKGVENATKLSWAAAGVRLQL